MKIISLNIKVRFAYRDLSDTTMARRQVHLPLVNSGSLKKAKQEVWSMCIDYILDILAE